MSSNLKKGRVIQLGATLAILGTAPTAGAWDAYVPDQVIIPVRPTPVAPFPFNVTYFNMQTRARAVGGDVDISSMMGEGTTVLAWVPR